jgi:hypothetical protein
MEVIETRIAFIEICLGSFVGNPTAEYRENLLLGKLSTLPVEENFKDQLKSYIGMSREELKEEKQYYRYLQKSNPGK